MKNKSFLSVLCLLTPWQISGEVKQTKAISAALEAELVNYSLDHIGEVPEWLSGTLIRNGPIEVTVNGQTNRHWFDGLAMIHAFSFHQGKVKYSNRFLRSDAYHTVFDKGSLRYDGFAVDPCRSRFKKFLTFFISSSHPAIQNANVNIAKIADEYVALTEIPLPVKFDPQTLDTLGVLDYHDALPKEKCWESAHPHSEQLQGRMWNYLIKFGKTSYYTLYTLDRGSSERRVVAEVPVDKPAYMHSFAMTENYVVFTEFPFVVSPLDLLLRNQPFIKNFKWEPQRGTRLTVVDKRNGSVVGKYTTRPLFAFHHANAFEKDGCIHMDLVTYADAHVIEKADGHDPSKLERITLSLDTGDVTSRILFPRSIELPRINERFDGKSYRCLYLTSFQTQEGEEGFFHELYKIDTETGEILEWSEKGCSIGEPVFVERPNGEGEDEGVVLAVVLDHAHHDSFLLILDGKSFKEIGRARTPHVIPTGLHGQFFK